VSDRDEHGGRGRVFTAVDQRRRHLVVREHLDHALGASLRVRHEHHGLAGLACGAKLPDPVRDPARESHRRLARDVPDGVLRAQGQRLDRRRLVQRRRDLVPADDQRRGRRDALVLAHRLRVAGVNLLALLDDGGADFVRLRHQQGGLRVAEVVEERGAAILGLVVVDQQLLQRDDMRLVDRFDRSLGARIVGRSDSIVSPTNSRRTGRRAPAA
jgi:hypothetical protein